MKIVADLHVHTISSGHAYSTAQEILSSAKAKGLQMVAITDHGPSMPGAPHIYHFGNLRVIPEQWEGVQILKGVEANISDFAGSLDLPDNYLRNLDWVLGGFHTYCYPGGTIEQNTQAAINALHHPLLDVLVHPGNPEFPINPVPVLEAAREMGKVVEINNSSLVGSRKGSKPNCLLIAQLVAQRGDQIIIGSDCHWAPDVGRCEEAIQMCLQCGIAPEQIINISWEALSAYLERRRVERHQG